MYDLAGLAAATVESEVDAHHNVQSLAEGLRVPVSFRPQLLRQIDTPEVDW